MRYLLSVEQKVFFKQHGVVELEELFSRDQAQAQQLDQEAVKKLAKHPTLLHLASELFQHKMLKFAGSEIIELPYTVSASRSFESVSCIQGLVGVITIGIEGGTHVEVNLDKVPFPQAPGSVTFFLPKAPWEKEKLALRPPQKCLLIAYAEPQARFVYNEKDPELLRIKKLGLDYGDRLPEEHFPTFFAK